MNKKILKVDPLNGSILKNMIIYALPIMGTAFLQMLFNSVDTMVIGKFGTENAMASVGAGSSIIRLIVTAVTALATGISITIGIHCGKGNMDEVKKLIHSLPLTGFLIGIVMAIFAQIFAANILRLVDCPDSLMSDAVLYFRIYFMSMPFMLTFSFLSSVLQARGMSFQPFVIQVVSGATNLILNLILVIGFHWNVMGVAVATLISQIVSTTAIVGYFVFFEKEVPLDLRKMKAFTGLWPIFSLGIPSSLSSMAMNMSGVILQNAINGFPEHVISGNTVASSIEGLITVAFVGFSGGSTVFVSQNFGRQNMKRVKKVQRTSFFTVLILGELLGILIYLAAGPIISLYTDVPKIAECAKLRMLYMCLPYGLCGTMNIMSGCIRGMKHTKIPLVISLICSCAFRIVWICTYARWKGTISSIYVSYPLCWGLATTLYLIAFTVIWKKHVRKINVA